MRKNKAGKVRRIVVHLPRGPPQSCLGLRHAVVVAAMARPGPERTAFVESLAELSDFPEAIFAVSDADDVEAAPAEIGYFDMGEKNLPGVNLPACGACIAADAARQWTERADMLKKTRAPPSTDTLPIHVRVDWARYHQTARHNQVVGGIDSTRSPEGHWYEPLADAVERAKLIAAAGQPPVQFTVVGVVLAPSTAVWNDANNLFIHRTGARRSSRKSAATSGGASGARPTASLSCLPHFEGGRRVPPNGGWGWEAVCEQDQPHIGGSSGQAPRDNQQDTGCSRPNGSAAPAADAAADARAGSGAAAPSAADEDASAGSGSAAAAAAAADAGAGSGSAAAAARHASPADGFPDEAEAARAAEAARTAAATAGVEKALAQVNNATRADWEEARCVYLGNLSPAAVISLHQVCGPSVFEHAAAARQPVREPYTGPDLAQFDFSMLTKKTAPLLSTFVGQMQSPDGSVLAPHLVEFSLAAAEVESHRDTPLRELLQTPPLMLASRRLLSNLRRAHDAPNLELQQRPAITEACAVVGQLASAEGRAAKLRRRIDALQSDISRVTKLLDGLGGEARALQEAEAAARTEIQAAMQQLTQGRTGPLRLTHNHVIEHLALGALPHTPVLPTPVVRPPADSSADMSATPAMDKPLLDLADTSALLQQGVETLQALAAEIVKLDHGLVELGLRTAGVVRSEELLTGLQPALSGAGTPRTSHAGAGTPPQPLLLKAPPQLQAQIDARPMSPGIAGGSAYRGLQATAAGAAGGAGAADGGADGGEGVGESERQPRGLMNIMTELLATAPEPGAVGGAGANQQQLDPSQLPQTRQDEEVEAAAAAAALEGMTEPQSGPILEEDKTTRKRGHSGSTSGARSDKRLRAGDNADGGTSAEQDLPPSPSGHVVHATLYDNDTPIL